MRSLSCIVIGDDVLARSCAAHIVDTGHELLALVTHSPSLREWGEHEGHRVLSDEIDDVLEAAADIVIVTAPDASSSLSSERVIRFRAAARWPVDSAAALADALLLADGGVHTFGWQRGDGRWVSVTDMPLDKADTAKTAGDKLIALAFDEFQSLLVHLARGGADERVHAAPAPRRPSAAIEAEARWRERCRVLPPSPLHFLRRPRRTDGPPSRAKVPIALPPAGCEPATLVAAAAIAAARCLQVDSVALAMDGRPIVFTIFGDSGFGAIAEQATAALAAARTLARPPADANQRWLDWPDDSWQGRVSLELGEGPLASADVPALSMQEACLSYDAGYLEPAFVEAFAQAVAFVLESGTADPQAPIAKLPLTPNPSDRTMRENPPSCTVVDLIREQAERTPSLPALSYKGRRYTYRELREATARLSGRILSLHRAHSGGQPIADRPIALCLERSDRMTIAIHAVLESGACFLPLDTRAPTERLGALLAEARPAIIVTTQDLLRRHGAAFDAWAVLDVDDDHDVDARTLPPVHAQPNNLAYVLYTSGSTGRPKGVMIEHGALLNRLQWMQTAYELADGHRVLQKTPYTFDVSVWEFLWPFMTGAELVVAEPDGHRDPAYLVDTIAERAITHLHFVPSMLSVFLQARGIEALGSLRCVFASGEALPPNLLRRFFERLPGCALENLYGPTEAAIDVSAHSCRPEDTTAPSIPIGRAAANCRLHVLDAGLQPLPAGVPGELWLGGVQLARGYLGRPDLTSEWFVPEPFAKAGRLYRTGDLARQLGNGEFEYLGRRDHQVKIRGMRVELGEIEAQLSAAAGVSSATVLRQQTPHPELTVAYLTGDDISIDEVRRHAARWLPDYMLPDRYVVLDRLPLTANGKVDRAALLVIEHEPEVFSGGNYANEPEARLAAIWRRLLRRSDVRQADDFFRIGGNSLLAGEMMQQVERDFGVSLTFRKVYDNPTLERLATCLAQPQASPAVTSRLAVEEF